jgi:hypothetical protein
MTASQFCQGTKPELGQLPQLPQPLQSICYHSGTLVAFATAVVKEPESTLSETRQIVPDIAMAADEWKTFGQRADWCLERYKHKPGMKNQSTWAKAAKKKSSVSSARTRENKNSNFRIEPETAVALAEVAGVDPNWLRTGEGLPDGSKQAMALFDTHQMRRSAADLLSQLHGVEPEKAWWLMRDIELDEPTRDGFLLEANRRLRSVQPAAELTDEKVRGFTSQLTRQLKGQS